MRSEGESPQAPLITSARNPAVQELRQLGARRTDRDAAGLGVLEGVRLAEEALRAGVQVPYFLYAPALLERERGRALVAALQSAGARALAATADVLARAATTQTPQGIVAAFRIPAPQPDDLATGLVLVAEAVQDPGNLGTLVRAGHALGGAGLVAAGGVDPWSPKAVRAAMGSSFHLPVVRVATVADVLPGLRRRGYRLLLADAAGRDAIWSVNLTGAVAVILGSEADGPSDMARSQADGSIRIPMPTVAESLNVGVAGGLVLYEALRQCTLTPASSGPYPATPPGVRGDRES